MNEELDLGMLNFSFTNLKDIDVDNVERGLIADDIRGWNFWRLKL